MKKRISVHSRKKTLLKNLFFFLVFFATSALIFWKCRYGYGDIDESFYLTVPYRMCLGDALFTDEWHLSQMAGFILYPFVWIYAKINGNLDGIILAARYLCTAIQCSIGMFIYFRTRKINWLGASVAAICYTLYIPFNITALSYNSMGIMALVVTLVILLTAETVLYLQYIIAGMFFAFAVLCNPYLLFVYLLYVLFVCTKSIIDQRISFDTCCITSLKGLLYITIGAVIIAVIFLAFVFSRMSIIELIEAIPAILGDPEHTHRSFAYKLYMFFNSIIIQRKRLLQPIYLAMSVLLLICLCDKERVKHKLMYFFTASLLTICLMVIHFRINYINHLMWSLNILGPIIFLISSDKSVKQIFYLLWLPGMLYAFCLHLSSNQTFYAISSASTVAIVGSILMLALFAEECFEESDNAIIRNFVCLITAFMMLFQISTEALLRYKHIFWDSEIETQTCLIEHGIEAGIYVSEPKHKLYYDYLQNLSILHNYDAKKVLYLSDHTWFYLTDDYEFACYSAWLSGVNEVTIARLKQYYSFNPEKMPDVVYVEIKNQQYAETFCKTFGYASDQYEHCLVLTPIK